MRTQVNVPIGEQAVRAILTNPQTKKIVIVAHAFGDRISEHSTSKLSHELAKENIATIEFAFRGTPPSDGKSENMCVQSEVDDCKTVFDYVKEQGFEDIALLGKSLGGLVISHIDDAKVMAYWYTAFDLTNTLLTKSITEKERKEIEEQEKTVIWGVEIGKRFFEDIQTTHVRKLPNKPSLFIHGDADPVVPVQQAIDAYESLEAPKQLEIVKGADHVLTHYYDHAIDKTVEFMRKHL